MKTLKILLENKSVQRVKTYIQSGNIILSGIQNPENEIGTLIQTHVEFSPTILVLSCDAFNSTVLNNDYQAAEGKPMHFYFCKEMPTVDHDKLKQLVSSSEYYQLIDKVFYLLAPHGIGRSKPVKNLGACLRSTVTGRNLNTINKLNE